ncbi:hypothetical protein [uncultured Erythrobacter sp.]|uniref:hypothetical protein n=1 Tax=uncultured Erythrobacter sp. TaxID=263913 RepID=UPI00261F47A7|nr:hypothetical protein [uncultured Erythrobacter sp.]
MARKSLLIIAAEIDDAAAVQVKALLASMTLAPGQADPANPLIPFGQIASIHFARFVVLEDPSLGDRAGITDLPVSEPTRLALMVDGDGAAGDMLEQLVARAAPGLAQIFAHCDPSVTAQNIGEWMHRHRIRAAAQYANAPSRTALQAREEAALHDALLSVRLAHPGASPKELWPHLKAAAASVVLSPQVQPSFAQRIKNFAHMLSVPVLAVALLPAFLLALPILIWMLRKREKVDPVIAPRPLRARNAMLSGIEDHDVANQYSAIGSLKPGRFRRWLTIVILFVINWGSQHIFSRGRLARVNTIHFASWTFLDDKRRIFFASNYDGSREAYNDDFINKVAFGLNLSFSNGLGYPRTDWLVKGGAQHEQDFKWYLFHHQIPTQLWYNAFRGLTTYEMARNARLRAAIEQTPSGDALARLVAEI